MKPTHRILLSVLLSLLCFAGITYTSCRKTNTIEDPGITNKCSSTVCYNGGHCNAGSCLCPLFYGGTQCEIKPGKMTFVNTALTDVSLHVFYETRGIQPQDTTAFSCAMGVTYTDTAIALCRAAGAGIIGEIVQWPVSATGDSVGTLTPLAVPADYFLLRVTNSSPVDAVMVRGNYGLAAEKADSVVIPHDGVMHTIGYYKAFANSNVRIESATGHWDINFSLPFTPNQVRDVVIN